MNKETARVLGSLARLGIDRDDAQSLRRISLTLHRWHERECGDSGPHSSWSLERDETTGKPYSVVYYHDGRTVKTPMPDREASAKKRLGQILARYPTLTPYIQTDPRGCSLYLLRPEDIRGPIDSCYSNGIAVY